MSRVITRQTKANLPLLMEQILAAFPELAPIPDPTPDPDPIIPELVDAMVPVFTLEGDDTSTTITLPDSFTNLTGLAAVWNAHINTDPSAGEVKRTEDAVLRQSIKTKFQALGFTTTELKWLDERWRG